MRPLANLGSLCTPFVPSTSLMGTPFPLGAGRGGGGMDCVATLILQLVQDKEWKVVARAE